MNYPALKFWMDVVLVLINLGIGLYVWWTNRDKATNARFNTLADRLTELEKMIERRKECPHHPQFEARLDVMNSSLSKMCGRLEGIGRAVDLMNQHLIGLGGKQ